MELKEPGYELRTDLVDSHIEICSREVLSNMKDDPNLQGLDDGFLTNLVDSEIIFDQAFYHIVKEPYYYAHITCP